MELEKEEKMDKEKITFNKTMELTQLMGPNKKKKASCIRTIVERQYYVQMEVLLLCRRIECTHSRLN